MKGDLIEAADLDMLGALADLLEERASLLSPPHPPPVAVLGKSITYLVDVVQQAADIPYPLRDQILAHLTHVMWLLQEVDTLGVDHAVAAVERVTGKVTAAAAKTRTAGLRKVAVGLTAALAVVQTNARQTVGDRPIPAWMKVVHGPGGGEDRERAERVRGSAPGRTQAGSMRPWTQPSSESTTCAPPRH